jgi:hypothetical protein
MGSSREIVAHDRALNTRLVVQLHDKITLKARQMARNCFTYAVKNRAKLLDIVFAFCYFIITQMLLTHWSNKFMKTNNKSLVLTFERDVEKYWQPAARFVKKYDLGIIAPTVLNTFTMWMAAAQTCSQTYRGRKLSKKTHVFIVFMAALVSVAFSMKSIASGEISWVDQITKVTVGGIVDNPNFLTRMLRNVDNNMIISQIKMVGLMVVSQVSLINSPSYWMQSADTISATFIKTNIYRPALDLLFQLILSGHLAISTKGGSAFLQLMFPKHFSENKFRLTNQQNKKNCVLLEDGKIKLSQWEMKEGKNLLKGVK